MNVVFSENLLNSSSAHKVVALRLCSHLADNFAPKYQWFSLCLVYIRNTQNTKKKLIIDEHNLIIVDLILDYLKKNVHNVFTATTNTQGVLWSIELEVPC